MPFITEHKLVGKRIVVTKTQEYAGYTSYRGNRGIILGLHGSEVKCTIVSAYVRFDDYNKKWIDISSVDILYDPPIDMTLGDRGV